MPDAYSVPPLACWLLPVASLHAPQGCERPIPAEELERLAVLHEPALVEHEDPVGVEGQAQLVGDDQHGATAGGGADRSHDRGFRGGVEPGRGLVQQQEGGVAHDGPGQGDPPALAPGQ